MGDISPALAIHRYLFRLALAAGNIFGWIVVFRVLHIFAGDISLALAGTAILFVLQQGITLILTPLAGAALRHGARRALILGSLSTVLSFGFLAQLFVSRISIFPEVALSLIASFVVFGGIQRALYFVPYAAASAMSDSKGVSFLREASLAFVPLLGGLLIASVPDGFGLLFAVAAAFALAACFALVEMPEIHERFEWNFAQALGALFALQNQRMLWVAVLDGVQGAALLLIWPLAAFLILGQSILSLGVVLTVTFLAAFLGRNLVRGFLKRIRAESPYVIATIAFSSWIFRLAAGTPFHVVIADVYYHSGARPHERGVDVHAGDQWADSGHYLDEYTALKEMGLCMGRIAVCMLFAALAVTYAPAVAFFGAIGAAAVAAATSVLLSHRLKKEAF